MIKKIFSLLAFLMLSMHIANAVPAYNSPVVITQPDGTKLTIIGHGDEFLNYITTADGYTVVKGKDNYYRYANIVDGKLEASDVIARDAEARSSAEVAFLSARAKFLRPEMTAASKEFRRRRAEMVKRPQLPRMNNAPKKGIEKGDYKGLVILVNYNDRQFRLGDDANAVFNDIINKEHFEGFEDPDYGYQEYTGSVHDYFVDNSMGQFNANFDVVGPVDIDYSCKDFHGVNATDEITMAVLDAVDEQIDFADYDSDGDGVVDMFYIIYAGFASSYTGNDEGYLWPHAYDLAWYWIEHDGVLMGRYACSTEIYGWEQTGQEMMEGIGTIVHEFSHVLGYPDLYDTTYKGYDHPGQWDIMAGGNYFNHSRTPVGYSAYERDYAGFTSLDVIDETGTYSLEPLHTSNRAYRIDTNDKDESGKVLQYFILEDRKHERWDEYLPGEGMLITRIDLTNEDEWEYYNNVNSTERPGVKIVRALGGYNNDGFNSFPGKGNVTFITNDTEDNLRTYEGEPCDFNIYDIRLEDGNISFRVVEDGYNPLVKPENALLYETFYYCTRQGGNDGDFKHVGSGELKADNEGWTGTNVHAASSCAVVGKSTLFVSEESITSPAVTLEEGIDYRLTFSAAGYDSSRNEPLNLTVSEGEGTLNVTTVDLEKAAWNDYTATLTGNGEVKISWGRKKSAFYLDTVMIEPVGSTDIEDVAAEKTMDGAVYNLAGQKVNAGYKGLVIKNGRKLVNR